MQKLLRLAVIALVGMFTSSVMAQVHVRGHTRKDGTYVAPHYRSSPDGSKANNWSTKGNINPYTGKEGTVNPYKTTRAPASLSAPAHPSAPAPAVAAREPQGNKVVTVRQGPDGTRVTNIFYVR